MINNESECYVKCGHVGQGLPRNKWGGNIQREEFLKPKSCYATSTTHMARGELVCLNPYVVVHVLHSWLVQSCMSNV